MAENTTKPTPTPWVAVPQDGAGHYITHIYDTGDERHPTGLRLIAHMLERKASLAEDKANADLICTAVNAWNDLPALEARAIELRNVMKGAL